MSSMIHNSQQRGQQSMLSLSSNDNQEGQEGKSEAGQLLAQAEKLCEQR